MRLCGFALVLCAAFVLIGCPRTPRDGTTGPGDNAAQAAADAAALRIPPDAASRAALARVTKRALSRDASASWVRARYLLDLFDDARFATAADSRAALAAALGQPERSIRGRAGTDRVISALQLEVDRVLAVERLHAAAQAARTLLDADAHPATRRGQVLQRMTELKAIARGESVVANNARLRLADYCLRALEDATRARWAERTRRAAHCLYPLYDSDPEPYFSRDPSKRPPAPRVEAIMKKLGASLTRLTRLTRDPSRLRRAGERMSRRFARLERSAAKTIGAPPDPSGLSLPHAKTATPYDWTPLLMLGDGRNLPDETASAMKLERPLRGDGRSTISVVLSAGATARSLHHAASIAHRAGASMLHLVVGLQQRLDVPQGDYWSGRTNGTVLRAGVLPITLRSATNRAQGRPAHGARTWDPARATLGLTLALSATTWTLAGNDGQVAVIRSMDTDALRAALTKVRAAYDFEQGLVIAPAPDVPYAHVVAAMDAASRDAAGLTLLPRQLLRSAVPSRTGRGLATRIERRRIARVTIEPAAMMRQKTLVRRCYQDALERRPGFSATLRVEGDASGVRVRRGTNDTALRACIGRSLRDVMRGSTTTSATLILSPRER